MLLFDADTVMHTTLIEFNRTQRDADATTFRAGDVVRVHRKIVEGNKERIQVFEGMVIVMRGGQSSSPMMTVRKVSNGVGVEIVVPIYSPNIVKIERVKRAKVRRANIRFIRTKPVKKLRFSFTDAKTVEEKEAAYRARTANDNTDDAAAADTTTSASTDTPTDDLTKIEGIGPKIAQTLADAGITTFAALADADTDTIEQIISSVRGSHSPATWSKQAALARDGKWEELSAWQEELVGGKEA